MVALAPLAAYLLMLGAVNLSRRPLVISGTRDWAALGVGVSGLMIIGPIELFFSTMLMRSDGPIFWLLVLGLYGSGWMMLVLHAKPRIVVYNATEDDLRDAAETVSRQIDPAAHWVGDTLMMPDAETQLVLEPFAAMRNLSLAPTGESLNLSLWRQMHLGLRRALRDSQTAPSLHGFFLLATGVLLTAVMAMQWIGAADQVTDGLREMFRV